MRNHGFWGGRGTIPDATGTFHELAVPILSAGRILDVMTSGGYLGKETLRYMPFAQHSWRPSNPMVKSWRPSNPMVKI